jgi:tetratricopeptide (TPR) repeat protein
MALVCRDRGELAGASARLQEAKAIFEDMDALPCLAQVDLSLGSVLALQGRADEANRFFQQAIERQEAIEALPELCESYLTWAQFMAGEGRLVEAEFYLVRGEGLVSRADCPLLYTLLNLVEGEIGLQKGRGKGARGSFEKALTQARKLENPHQEAKALAGMGRAALLDKDYDAAESFLSQALSICRPLGARGEITAISRSLQQLFLSRGDHARAEEMAALQNSLPKNEDSRPQCSSTALPPIAAAARISLGLEK